MGNELRRKASCSACDLRVRVSPHPITVVVYEEFTAALFEEPEKVDERCHGHKYYLQRE